MRYESGDIFACHGTDVPARVIRWGTVNPFARCGLMFGPSHVAICGTIDGHATTFDPAHPVPQSPVWIESTTLSRLPCILRGECVSGMQVHFPDERIEEYRAAGGRVDLYRLSAIQSLDDVEAALLNRILLKHFVTAGASYDMRGAILSGLRVFKWSSLFPGADLNRLFCSEVIAAVLMRLNRMRRENPTRFNPANLLRELVYQGVYYLEQRDVVPGVVQGCGV